MDGEGALLELVLKGRLELLEAMPQPESLKSLLDARRGEQR